MRARRDHRIKIVGTVTVVALLVTLSSMLGWRWLPAGLLTGGGHASPANGEVFEVSIDLIGIACGSHLSIVPNFIEAEPGGTIRITNDGPWPHEIHLSTKDRAALMDDPSRRNDVIVSVTLQPGEVRDIHLPASSGDYFLVAGNQWHYMAGLRGWVHAN